MAIYISLHAATEIGKKHSLPGMINSFEEALLRYGKQPKFFRTDRPRRHSNRIVSDPAIHGYSDINTYQVARLNTAGTANPVHYFLINRDADIAGKVAISQKSRDPLIFCNQFCCIGVNLGGSPPWLYECGGCLEHLACDLTCNPHLADFSFTLYRDLHALSHKIRRTRTGPAGIPPPDFRHPKPAGGVWIARNKKLLEALALQTL